ncbi:MAG: guanylate kinase [Eubacterium sp.]|nr:guanylate kinase [Eubacterium sp.]
MGKIFCLMGKSASGKDTIYNQLLKSEELNLHNVILYTTRPIRSGEKDGETYFFCSDEKACQLEAAGKVIEMRAYDTMHGVWKYFTADDGQIDLASDNFYLMIGTLEAYEKIRDYFGAEQVLPIYIHVDDGLRLARALERERAQAEPKYAELCRRFLADEEDFSREKRDRLGISQMFENECLEETVQRILQYMREHR